MQRSLCVVVQVLCVTSLKLLESTYPSTPYKSVGPNLATTCQNIEVYGSLDEDTKCGSGTTVDVAIGSKCAIETESALKAYVAAVVAEGHDDASTIAKRDAVEKAADLCCANLGTGSDADAYSGMTNFYGLERYVGLTDLCGGYAFSTAASCSSYADRDPNGAGCIAFYETGTNACSPTAATSPFASGEGHEGESFTKLKVTAAPPGTITPATGDPVDVMETAKAGGANNELIEAGRTQCTKSGTSWWTTDTACGGFCITKNTAAYQFFAPGQCYLSYAGAAVDTADAPSASAQSVCYSSLGLDPAPADMPKVFNDPKVVNMQGESFDILSTGTFSMLNIYDSSMHTSFLDIHATIDRAGSVCGATYIQNASLSGSWVQNLDFAKIEVRATAALPKKQSLQVSVNKGVTWQQPSDFAGMANVSTSGVGQISFSFKSLVAAFSVDSHRIVEGSKKTRRFANFLNLNIAGMKAITSIASLQVGGLLGRDSHAAAAAMPEGCNEDSVGLQLMSRVELGKKKPCPIEKCGIKR